MEPFTFFISYRRIDTAPVALLLKHELEKRLQFLRVFVDVEALQPGEDFPDRIRRSIEAARATIVLIGDRWMPARAGKKAPSDKKQKPNSAPDYVALEIEASLNSPVRGADGKRIKAERTIVPVFINRERGFSDFDLPDEIKAISTLNAERLDYASWPDAIGPFIEKLALRFNVKKRPDAESFPDEDPTKARTQPIDEDELTRILSYRDFDGWYVDNFGNSDIRYLVKTFRFPKSFERAAQFMRMVSDHCMILDHHPEWRNVFDHVTVSLTTWDARRQVTIYDLNLALFMNRAAEAVTKGRANIQA